MAAAASFVGRTQQFEDTKKYVRKDFFDVTADFANEKSKTVFKLVYTGIDVANELNAIPAEYQEAFGNARQTFNLIKLGHGVLEFIPKVNEWRHSFQKLTEKFDWSHGGDLFLKTNSLISPVWEGVDFGTKAIFNIPKNHAFVQTLKGISGVSLVISMGHAAAKSMNTISTSNLSADQPAKDYNKAFSQVTQALIDLVKSIACVALGVLTVLSVFFSIIAAGYVFTALSATTVVLSIVSYYHKQLAVNKAERKIN